MGTEEDIKTGIQVGDASSIFGGELIGIGGEYQTKYALVN